MSYSLRGWGILVAFALVLSAALRPAEAGPGPADKLTEFDYLLLGLSLRADPPTQVVPRNTATGIRVELAFSSQNADAAGLLSLLPSGLEVVAELVGPGITPQELRGAPGAILPVPPLVERGLYLVRDIRLERDGELFLRASPDAATIEVIERVLITQVTTRPLTIEEIRQKGILFGDDSFTGFNFTLALKLDSIKADGGTNMSHGLDVAYETLRSSRDELRAARIIGGRGDELGDLFERFWIVHLAHDRRGRSDIPQDSGSGVPP